MYDQENGLKMRKTGKDAATSQHQDHYLKEISLKLSHNTKIRVATLIAVIVFAISSTWGLNEVFRVEDIKYELEARKLEIEQLKISNNVLTHERDNLSSSYEEIKKTSKIPTIVYPVNWQHVIGRQVKFKWKYSKEQDPGFQNLVIEIIKSGENDLQTRRFHVSAAGEQSKSFEFPEGITGHFFWRIGTGELLNDKEGTRLWSRYGSFSLYPSVIDKIKDKKEIIVGTVVKFIRYSYPISCLGDPVDYDIEFARWITDRLKEELVLRDDITMRIKYIEWEKLLPSVTNGYVDLAIADITYSRKREDEYQGLLFTKGYRENKQVFIRHKDKNSGSGRLISRKKDISAYLHGKKVGAQKSTINADAASYLAKIFKFEVSAVYSSYTDVVEAVYEKKIDYGIIDSLVWKSVSYPEIEVLNFYTEPYLREMYEKVLGSNHEFYAIAVPAKDRNNDFLNLLNQLIDSDRGKAKRKELEEKYRAKNLITKKADKFECNIRDREWHYIANALNEVTPQTAFEMRKIFNETHVHRSQVNVQDIKDKLNKLGYYSPSASESNAFSSEITEQYIKAVMDFQKAMNMLHIDGIVGPYTKARINQEARIKSSRRQ
jgi:ABC-type amino acid transport substrate-binding protein